MSSNDTSYNDVLYPSKPLFATHPDVLAAAGRLRGLQTAAPSSCRVLELGCATGGNIMPMACALPGSRFVGIDLSERQVDDGNRLIQRLGIDNIQLKAASIADVDESWGKYDFLICHGVYSWVPPAIQDKILWICRNLLSPSGVAYISYNTYPGWHLRTIVRDLMKLHAARFDDPATKVQQARQILDFMAYASAQFDSPFSRVLGEEAKGLPDAADYYLFHEHLEDQNHPLYFHEFVAKARAAGLDYLGEAWHHTQFDRMPPDVQETLQAISSDLIEMEQFADFIRGRTFRRTLLCQGEVEIARTPSPSVLDSLFVSTMARPASDNPDIHSENAETFVLVDDSTATTNAPIFKAAIMRLLDVWPQAMPFAELLDAVIRDLALTGQMAQVARPLLASFLIEGYVSHIVAIHCEPFPICKTISQRPRASKLAQVLAAEKPRVPNLRHRLVDLSPPQQLVIQLADGTRTLEQIADAAVQGNSQLFTEPTSTVDAASTSPISVIEQTLHQLARSALLEA